MEKLSLREGLLIFIASYIATYIGLGASRTTGPESIEEYFFSYTFLVVQGLFSAVLIALTLLAMGKRGVRMGSLLRPGVGAALLGIALGLALLPMEHIITSFTMDFLGRSETQRMLLKAASSSLQSFTLMLFLGGILAPLAEEVYFRGYMYSAMRQRMGANRAVVLNGLYFGLLHLDLPAFFAIAALGSALAYAYEKKNSLFLVIVAHSFINSIAFIAAYFGYGV